MATTFCLSGAVIVKAGANANAGLGGGTLTVFGPNNIAAVDTWINQQESVINAITKINYTDIYSGLDDDTKKVLEDVCSSLAAMYAIQYDMSGYSSRIEAETMLDVHRDMATRGMSLLKDDNVKELIGKT